MERVIFTLLLFTVLFSAAGEEPLPLAQEFTQKLGWTADEAFNRLGVPEELFSHRGRMANEDNVVFYYGEHIYLFWFRNRVWQVRADDRWSGEVDGIRMGASLAEVKRLWGNPINDSDENPTWTLPDRGYPVRIRLYFVDDSLADLYVYRSDW